MKQSKQLLLANRAWAVELTDENADFFSRSVAGQKPEFMWIGCSGSRVSPEQKTQTLPGRMVIHSNIANLVNPEDLNLMSTLQHAIDVLAVPNIIVCGHHGCGGIRATLSGSATGPVKHWLEPANAALHDHADEINSLPPGEAQVNRLVEVNVRDQLVNLARTETVQAAFARGQELTLHGWVYDIRDGQLKPLMEITRDTVLDEVGRPDPVLTV